MTCEEEITAALQRLHEQAGAFLRTLPVDGSYRELAAEELEVAYRLHTEKLAFLASGRPGPMVASITFEGRKVLSRA